MRKNFSLYSEPVTEAVSVRAYVHETGKAAQYHTKGVKLLQSLVGSITKPAQELLHAFHDFKKAMAEAQHLGVQKSGHADVTSTLRNILREIYGKKFDSIDDRMAEVEQHMAGLEKSIANLASEDVSQSLENLGKSKRQLGRERPQGIVQAQNPTLEKPPEEDIDHEMWQKSLPAKGAPDWDKWVAMRAFHIQKQKEAAHQRGDTSKGDDLHGHDWWDKKAHWQQAHDEIDRYTQSGKDNKQFVWAKHFKDWRAYIGYAINEYNNLKSKEDEDFFKSIMPPKPRGGYM